MIPPDPELMDKLKGLMTEKEAAELASDTKLPDIVFKKLEDPHLRLDADQQIECLSGCISVGATRARKARGRSVLMVIGNTGAGKSTFVNYIHGCSMELFKTDKGKKAIRVKEAESELMPIGHTNQSMTFIPGIESDDSFTYMDCPGFMDNRGAEINIANAVNIKQAIHAAESVVVAVVLNYYTLLSERGKGLRDLAAILQDMFGTGERLAEHTASIALGVSRVPLFDPSDGEKFALPDVRGLLEDLDGLAPAEAEVVRALQSRVFMFDPADRGDASDGWSSRGDLIALFRELEPVREPSSIFQTVLTPEDERALRAVVQEMAERVSGAMEGGDYEAAGATLAQLERIDRVDNPLVTRLKSQAADTVRARVMELREDAAQCLLFDDADGAERCLRSLRAASAGLSLRAPGYAVVAQQAAERVEAHTRSHRKMAEEREALRLELEQGRASRELLQKRLAQLDAERAKFEEEVSRLVDAMEVTRLEKARELEAAAGEFEREQDKLKARLESAGEEDKKKLRGEIERLTAEQEQNRRQLEERARQQEEQLRKTLEENERLLRAREQEAAEVQREKEEAVEREQRSLQQAASMDQRRAEARKVLLRASRLRAGGMHPPPPPPLLSAVVASSPTINN